MKQKCASSSEYSISLIQFLILFFILEVQIGVVGNYFNNSAQYHFLDLYKIV